MRIIKKLNFSHNSFWFFLLKVLVLKRCVPALAMSWKSVFHLPMYNFWCCVMSGSQNLSPTSAPDGHPCFLCYYYHTFYFSVNTKSTIHFIYFCLKYLTITLKNTKIFFFIFTYVVNIFSHFNSFCVFCFGFFCFNIFKVLYKSVFFCLKAFL